MNANNSGLTRDIERAKRGEDDAVTRLWNVCYERAVRHARRNLGGIPDRLVSAEDIAASAFKSVWKDIVAAPSGDTLRSEDLWRYLYTEVARKTCNQIRRINAQKRGNGQVIAETELAEDVDPLSLAADLFDDLEFQKECGITIDEFMAFLPDELRVVASLMLSFCLSNEEIACILQCSVRTVQRKVRAVLEHACRFHEHSSRLST
jgi:DNA-directed RNA polymerase specialized sigma24 family protein